MTLHSLSISSESLPTDISAHCVKVSECASDVRMTVSRCVCCGPLGHMYFCCLTVRWPSQFPMNRFCKCISASKTKMKVMNLSSLTPILSRSSNLVNFDKYMIWLQATVRETLVLFFSLQYQDSHLLVCSWRNVRWMWIMWLFPVLYCLTMFNSEVPHLRTPLLPIWLVSIKTLQDYTSLLSINSKTHTT